MGLPRGLHRVSSVWGSDTPEDHEPGAAPALLREDVQQTSIEEVGRLSFPSVQGGRVRETRACSGPLHLSLYAREDSPGGSTEGHENLRNVWGHLHHHTPRRTVLFSCVPSAVTDRGPRVEPMPRTCRPSGPMVRSVLPGTPIPLVQVARCYLFRTLWDVQVLSRSGSSPTDTRYRPNHLLLGYLQEEGAEESS